MTSTWDDLLPHVKVTVLIIKREDINKLWLSCAKLSIALTS